MSNEQTLELACFTAYSVVLCIGRSQADANPGPNVIKQLLADVTRSVD